MTLGVYCGEPAPCTRSDRMATEGPELMLRKQSGCRDHGHATWNKPQGKGAGGGKRAEAWQLGGP